MEQSVIFDISKIEPSEKDVYFFDTSVCLKLFYHSPVVTDADKVYSAFFKKVLDAKAKIAFSSAVILEISNKIERDAYAAYKEYVSSKDIDIKEWRLDDGEKKHVYELINDVVGRLFKHGIYLCERNFDSICLAMKQFETSPVGMTDLYHIHLSSKSSVSYFVTHDNDFFHACEVPVATALTKLLDNASKFKRLGRNT